MEEFTTHRDHPNFLKSLIRINNPDWTPQQIEEEYQIRIKAMEKDNDNCDMCSG